MENVANQLLEVIACQIVSQKDLLKSLKEMRQFLEQGEISAVEQCHIKIQGLLEQGQICGLRQESLTFHLATALKLKRDEIKLSTIFGRFHGPIEERYKKLKTQFNQGVDEIKRETETIFLFIHSALEVNQEIIKILMPPNQLKETYNKQAMLTPGRMQGLTLRQKV